MNPISDMVVLPAIPRSKVSLEYKGAENGDDLFRMAVPPPISAAYEELLSQKSIRDLIALRIAWQDMEREQRSLDAAVLVLDQDFSAHINSQRIVDQELRPKLTPAEMNRVDLELRQGEHLILQRCSVLRSRRKHVDLKQTHLQSAREQLGNAHNNSIVVAGTPIINLNIEDRVEVAMLETMERRIETNRELCQPPRAAPRKPWWARLVFVR
jgi:hypothetical protein